VTQEEAISSRSTTPARRERNRGQRSRPSLVDVARLAGVAPITVSRVANNYAAVQPNTRERVLSAMQQLGYRPNAAARALATGRFGTIGVITFTLGSYGNSQTIAAIVSVAEQRGYSVSLLAAHTVTRSDLRSAYSRLTKQDVDGVIVVIEAKLADDTSLRLPQAVPVVVVDAGGRAEYSVVDCDQVGGARSATEHLLSLGHRTVWHIAGPADSYSALARTDGWRSALLDAKARVPEVLFGDWSAQSGYEHGLTLAETPGCTSIFVANDQMALGVLRALHECGRKVPQEVSVVGFDDMPGCDNVWPPLTTVHQHFDQVGHHSVDMLLQHIADPAAETRAAVVPTSLKIRASTGSAPGRDVVRPRLTLSSLASGRSDRFG
jgi:DNA-binding LacI/PurR family transcriptional regulator